MLKQPIRWSDFKDFIYDNAFHLLQGVSIDVENFERAVFSKLCFPPKARDVILMEREHARSNRRDASSD